MIRWSAALFVMALALCPLDAQTDALPPQNEAPLITPLSPDINMGLAPGAGEFAPEAALPSPSARDVPYVPRTTVRPRRPRIPWPTPEAYQFPSAPTPHAEHPIPQPRGPQLNLPLYAPPGQHPGRTLLPVPVTPQTQMRRMQRQTYRPNEHLPPPQQGYIMPLGPHQRPQMQTEHHDYLMSHPQPQVNPPAPNVYQTPGDYSTLPGM